MENLEGILAEHPFFVGLPSDHFRLIVGCASNVRFPADHYVCREDQVANSFYLLREGKVALEIMAPKREPIVIQTIGEGEMLGWSWLVPPYRWSTHVRAIQPVRAIALDGKCLREKCENDSRLGYELLKRVLGVVGKRLEAARLQMLDLYAVNPVEPKPITKGPR